VINSSENGVVVSESGSEDSSFQTRYCWARTMEL